MKMPSTKTLAIIGAVVVVAIVVIGKLRSSSSSTTSAQTTTSDASTGVSTGQLSSFESEITSALDSWEQSQGSSTSTSTSSSGSSPSSTSSGSSTSPLPATGTVGASNPAPVVASPGTSPQAVPDVPTYQLPASDGETETVSPIAGGTLSTYTSSSGKVVGVIPNPTDGGVGIAIEDNAPAAGLSAAGNGGFTNTTGKTQFVSGYGYVAPGQTIYD